MANLLGLDTETTSEDPKTCEVTELGLMMWDTELGCPTTMFNALVQPYGRQDMSPGAVEVTGITQELREQKGLPHESVFNYLRFMMSQADFIVAHNAPFDKEVIIENAVFLDNSQVRAGAEKLPWIDTVDDLPYPGIPSSHKLGHLAADHGFLNPFPHRALFDVATMMYVLGGYEWDKVLAYWSEPQYEVVAHVTYATNKLAKERKFRWNPDRKIWAKNLRESELTEEYIDELPFDISKKLTQEQKNI